MTREAIDLDALEHAGNTESQPRFIDGNDIVTLVKIARAAKTLSHASGTNYHPAFLNLLDALREAGL